MATFLDWFASHNTLVIQSLAAIVALLIVVLIFRLLFANQQAATAGLPKDVTFAQLEEKLNKLLEQQSQMKVSVNAVTEGSADGLLGADAMAALSGDPEAAAAAAAGGEAGTAATEQVAELSRLRAEISTLKDSLKRKEVEITSAKEQVAQSADTAQQDAQLADLSGKITDYEKEIEALKNRLSDYEIIAEDIADLQAYKKENADLKNQLANQQPAAPAAAPAPAPEPVTEEPAPIEAAAEPNLEAIPDPEPEVEEPKAEVVADEMDALTNEDVFEVPIVPDDILTAANDVLSDIPSAETQAEEMPEVTGPEELDNEETREVSKEVKKEDKSLLDEFEKHFAKDED
ncbi:MAG: ELKS/Rab6-interacting/CAST family protein [Pseudobdellovibrio sp.]|nr:ELKS/Rab6-interacting/CAST family protein [Pseudobdellovibrio sp.]